MRAAQAKLDDVLSYLLQSTRVRAPFQLDLTKLLHPFGVRSEARTHNSE